MTFKQVVLAINGLREKDYYNQMLMRRSTMIVASAFGGKEIASRMNKIWPVRDKEQLVSNISEEIKEQMRKFREYDDKLKAKELYGRRTKTGS